MRMGNLKLSALMLAGGMIPMVPVASNVVADVYPQRPITVVVGYPAGGGADILARRIAERLSSELGQLVIVENRSGGSGNAAATWVANSAPDGYTFYIATTSTILHQLGLPDSQLSFTEDFEPVSILAEAHMVLVGGTHLPADSISGVVHLARDRPDGLTCATLGVGTAGDILCDALQRGFGARLQTVPYKGDAQALVDVLGVRADLFISSLGAMLPHIKAGRVQALAILSGGRTAQLPSVPGIEESGLVPTAPVGWFALMAPKNTPDHAVRRLNASVNKILAVPAVKDQLASLGYMPPVSTMPAEAVRRRITRDMENWGTLIEQKSRIAQ